MTIESYQNGRPYTGSGLLALGDEMTMVVTAPVISITAPDTNRSFEHLFVLPPGMERQPYRAEPVSFDPNNLPFISLSSIRVSQKKINALIDKGKIAYPKNIEQYKLAAHSDITMVNNSVLKNNPELKSAADGLQEALNSLQINIDMKNRAEQDVITKTQAAEQGFNAFVYDKDIKLGDFKNKNHEMFDAVLSLTYANLGSHKKHFLEKWHNLYVSKFQEEMAARNNLVAYLSLVTMIAKDVIHKTQTLKAIRKKNYTAEAEAAEKRRAEEEIRANAEKVKAEEKAKAEADATAKAIAEAKAEMEAAGEQRLVEEKARNKALASVGLIPVQRLAAHSEKHVEEAMKAAGAMVLSRAAAGGMQLSVAGQGALLTSGGVTEAIAGTIVRGVTAVLSSASLSAAAVLAAFWPTEAGKGSDRIPGRDVAVLFTLQAELLTASGAIQPGMATIEMPVRGSLVMENGLLALKLLKTGSGDVQKTVQILEAIRDWSTGLDVITVPAVEGQPSQTILVNPWTKKEKATTENISIPGVSVSGNGSGLFPDIYPLPGLASPATPVHTGTEIRPVGTIQVTTTPGTEEHLRDFIYWQLDASGTGVEPVYAMLSNPRNIPGIVTGNGKPVGEGWLNKADQELGAPIPSQIADKLEGKILWQFWLLSEGNLEGCGSRS